MKKIISCFIAGSLFWSHVSFATDATDLIPPLMSRVIIKDANYTRSSFFALTNNVSGNGGQVVQGITLSTMPYKVINSTSNTSYVTVPYTGSYLISGQASIYQNQSGPVTAYLYGWTSAGQVYLNTTAYTINGSVASKSTINFGAIAMNFTQGEQINLYIYIGAGQAAILVGGYINLFLVQ